MKYKDNELKARIESLPEPQTVLVVGKKYKGSAQYEADGTFTFRPYKQNGESANQMRKIDGFDAGDFSMDFYASPNLIKVSLTVPVDSKKCMRENLGLAYLSALKVFEEKVL